MRATIVALVLTLFVQDVDAAKKKAPPSSAPAPQSKSGGKLEDYRDLIQKAQNLSLQQDRLQASQVLVRGIQREGRGTQAFKELCRALDELTGLFYTERAQNIFSTGESLVETKPREAIDSFQEALKLEDRNVTVLKALARLHLRMDECDRAEGRVKQAEEVNPYSAEVKLLRLQTLSCQGGADVLVWYAANEPDLEPVKKFARGLRIKALLRKSDFKKARAELSEWETQFAEYPEVFFWKWEVSKALKSPDRTVAAKYLQLCQGLTPRKRKAYALDVALCKGRDTVEAFLKESESKGLPVSNTEGTAL